MAIIKVSEKYEIEIDSNQNYTAQIFQGMRKTVLNGEEKEIRKVKVLGYYMSAMDAFYRIYKDMCVSEANEKETVTVAEWISIMKKEKQQVRHMMSKIDYTEVENE